MKERNHKREQPSLESQNLRNQDRKEKHMIEIHQKKGSEEDRERMRKADQFLSQDRAQKDSNQPEIATLLACLERF